MISMLINMALRAEWAVLGIVLFILHHFFPKIPVWVGFAAFALWVIHAFLITILFFAANKAGSHQEPVKENKNPYSVGANKAVTPPVEAAVSVETNAEEHIDPHMCPCCNKYRFDEIGKYEVCPICGWEDDPTQRADASYVGGANHESLDEARINYKNREESAK